MPNCWKYQRSLLRRLWRAFDCPLIGTTSSLIGVDSVRRVGHRRVFGRIVALACVLTGSALAAVQSAAPQAPAATAAWPAWRGPLGTGEAPEGNPPIEFSETTNIAWKSPIPGSGASTPIIWGDTIYLQTAVPVGPEKAPRQQKYAFPEQMDVYYGQTYTRATRDQEFSMVAVSRSTGAIKWKKVLRVEQPAEGRHPTNTYASASPSTDGNVLIAFFGSRGLYALTMSGDVLWSHDFGDMDTRNGWGEGSSPTLFRNRVIVTWDHEGASFIAALDSRTGKELWRRERKEPTTWATPLVVSARSRGHVSASDLTRLPSLPLRRPAEPQTPRLEVALLGHDRTHQDLEVVGLGF
jgi:outer membrane protein assembly factor BamB